jgi:hypothetical protein
MSQPVCEECKAIAQQLRQAWPETWLSAGPELRQAWVARSKLRGGTEEDVLRAEELFLKAQRQSSPRIGNAIRRKLSHQAVSGHSVGKPANRE